MACRLINSPITGKQVQSKTWADLYSITGDEQQADSMYKQLLSPNFTNWFGDWLNKPDDDNVSKVVNEEGEPLVVYHGTEQSNKEEFKPRSFFTTDKEYAQQFGNAEAYFLNIKSPGYVEDLTKRVVEQPGTDGLIEDSDDKSLGQVFMTIEPNQVKAVTNNGRFSASDNVFLSKSNSIQSSKAAPSTVKFAEEFLKRIGVDLYDDVTRAEMKAGLSKLGNFSPNQIAYGIADMVEKVAWILKGKSDVALTEEAMHFAVAIIKQKNPALYKEMFNKVGQFEITRQVIRDKGYREAYKTPEGKPDILKLKEEAMGKILAEYVIEGLEGTTERPELIAKAQSWWKRILEWFGIQFNKTQMDIENNPFADTAETIIQGRFEGTADDIKDGDVFYSLENEDNKKQSDIYNKVKELSSDIVKDADGYLKNGVRVPNRVTDLTESGKSKYAERTAEEKVSDNAKADFGTKGHSDIEDIARRYINDDGFLRKDIDGNLRPLDQTNVSQLDPDDNTFYEILEDNFVARLANITDNFSKETRFLIEAVVYDPNFKSPKGIGEAGTMDFVAIQPDGVVDIYDWKFIGRIDEDSQDVTFYKKESWNTQLSEYKRILKDVYKVDNIRKTRAVPIITKYNIEGNVPTSVRSIQPGIVNTQEAEFDYQLPVPIQSERTGVPQIDKQIDKLQALYSKISQSPVTEGRKDVKAEQLNRILRTIRHLQVNQDFNQLFDSIEVIARETSLVSEYYKNNLQGREPSSVSDREASDFGTRLLFMVDKLQPFTDLLQLSKLFEPDSDIKARLSKVNEQVTEDLELLNDIMMEYGSTILSKKYGAELLTVAEKEYKGFISNLRTISEKGTAGTQAFYNATEKYINKIEVERSVEIRKYESIYNNYKEWASKKGLKPKNYFDLIFAKDKNGKFTNQRIQTIDKQFFEEFNKAIANRDGEWIQENVDVEAYKAWAEEKKQLELKAIEEQIFNSDPAKDDEARKRRIELVENKYNFTNENSSGYFQIYLNKYPKPKWYSKEYQQLRAKGNEPALAFFEHIQKVMDEAAKLGMISPRVKRTFLPFIRKRGLGERVIYNEGLNKLSSPVKGFFEAITIQEDDIEYGFRDPSTGEYKYELQARFTHDFENEEDLSTDLLKTIAMFSNEVIRYRNLSEIQGVVESILYIEKNKKSLRTNSFGSIQKDKNGAFVEQNNNTANYEFLFDHVKARFYGIKLGDEGNLDVVLGKIPQSWENTFRKINEKLGVKVFPENVGGRKVYLPKMLESLKQYFQLKVLNANIAIPLTNTFGGSMQRIINAGDYYSKSELLTIDAKVNSLSFLGKNDTVTVELLKILQPYLEIRDRDRVHRLASSKIGDTSFIQDILMAPYKYGTRLVELKHAVAMLNNAIVIDGNVKNVNIYLKEKYANRYSLSYEERKKLESRMEDEKKQLLKTNGLITNAKIENGEIKLPDNLPLTDDSLLHYRSIIVNLSKQFLGATTPEDLNRANMSSLWRSFLVFKNWIPPLLEPRFSELKYAPGTDRWEYGRVRMLGKVLWDASLWKLNRVRDIMVMNDNGVAIMKNLLDKHEKDFEAKTGHKLEIDEHVYFELYRKGLKDAMLDLSFFLTLVGVVMAAGMALDDDDDDAQLTGYSKFSLRLLNKFKEELEFFYNPVSLVDIANGNVIPPLSLIYDVKQLLKNTGEELLGITTGDDEMVEHAKPAKYLLRLHPLTNNITYLAGVASPDFAHSMGIKISTQSRSR